MKDVNNIASLTSPDSFPILCQVNLYQHKPSKSNHFGLLHYLAVFLLLLLGSVKAHAGLCVVPTESGAWKNYNSATRSITNVDFRMECRDASVTQCSGDICSTTSAVAPHFFIRLFGACTPTDCPWGEVEGIRLSGNLDGWYYFTYNQGFAQRYVYARTYPQWPGWFRLYIWTDFSDPGRADYASDEWFVRR